MEADNYLALILWHKGPRFVIVRRPQADVAISGRHCRPVPAAVKTACTVTDAIGLYASRSTLSLPAGTSRFLSRLTKQNIQGGIFS